ncbi:MAG: hypothetical protein HBSAPP03_03780 [Phycisphaerae bacterium]|nr:MAG: hypothetical protein HBSAPP03_03780 [Phycisphaerae bacterium]
MAERVRAWGLVCLGARVVLGGLFIFAGVLKLMNPLHFKQAIMAFKMGMPDHLTVLATFTFPWTEIIAGALLVLGWWARPAAGVIAAMLFAFITAMASVMLRGIDTHCSCFGKLEFPCGSSVGWCQIVRNSVLLVLVGIVLGRGAGSLALQREPRD